MIHLNNDVITRFDLGQRLAADVKTCGQFSQLLPNSTKTVCRNSHQQLYTFDLVTQQIEDLPVEQPIWFDVTPNGRFLYYEHLTPDQGYAISSCDLGTKATTILFAGLPLRTSRDWLDRPLLSADGLHLVVTRQIASGDARVFECEAGSNNYKQIGPDKPSATMDLAWSPVAPQFIYGASDIQREVGYSTNHLHLVDMRSRTARLLAKAPAPGSYDAFLHGPVWSPDGARIAVTSGRNLCVITVATGQEDCQQVTNPGNGISIYTWSPAGNYVAFIAVRSNRISAYAPGSQKLITLAEGLSADWIDWR